MKKKSLLTEMYNYEIVLKNADSEFTKKQSLPKIRKLIQGYNYIHTQVYIGYLIGVFIIGFAIFEAREAIFYRQETSVSSPSYFASPHWKSGYYRLTGLFIDDSVSLDTHSYYPLVPKNYQKDQPVPLLLSMNKPHRKRLEKENKIIPNQPSLVSLSGLVKTKIPSSVLAEFQKKNIKVNQNTAVLTCYQAPENSYQFLIIMNVIGWGEIFLLRFILFCFCWSTNRKFLSLKEQDKSYLESPEPQ